MIVSFNVMQLVDDIILSAQSVQSASSSRHHLRCIVGKTMDIPNLKTHRQIVILDHLDDSCMQTESWIYLQVCFSGLRAIRLSLFLLFKHTAPDRWSLQEWWNHIERYRHWNSTEADAAFFTIYHFHCTRSYMLFTIHILCWKNCFDLTSFW